MSEAGLRGWRDLQDFFLSIVKGKSRKSRNLENPDADKMSEAGFVELGDGQDFFLSVKKI